MKFLECKCLAFFSTTPEKKLEFQNDAYFVKMSNISMYRMYGREVQVMKNTEPPVNLKLQNVAKEMCSVKRRIKDVTCSSNF